MAEPAVPSIGPQPSAAHRRGGGAGMIRNATASVVLPGGVFLVLAALLELAKRANWLPITVPAPTEIADALTVSWSDLLYHMGPTVLAAAAGYFIAALIAFLLGALATSWPHSEETVLKVGIIVDSVPLIA